MRATMSFSLPEEEAEHRAAMQGMDYKNAIEEFDQFLRATIKHAGLPVDQESALRDARTRLLNILDEYGVTLY